MRPSRELGRDLTLREVVIGRIRQKVYNGEYKAGERLVERDLASDFGVSRLPVREALRTLRQEGLLIELPKRGIAVRPLERKDVEELFDVREALEVMACQLAARRATEEDLGILRDLVQQSREAVIAHDVAAAREASGLFHDEIIRIADNDLLRATMEPLHGRLQWLFHQAADVSSLCTEHEALLRDIASGLPELAAQSARHHVEVNRINTLGQLFVWERQAIELLPSRPNGEG